MDKYLNANIITFFVSSHATFVWKYFCDETEQCVFIIIILNTLWILGASKL